jgi:hypothetical protein
VGEHRKRSGALRPTKSPVSVGRPFDRKVESVICPAAIDRVLAVQVDVDVHGLPP